MVVIRIKHFHQVTRQVLLLHCLIVLTLVKAVQLKGINSFCIPDTQGIDNIVAVTYNRKIHRHSQNGLILLLNKMILAVLVLNPYIAAELNSLCIFRTAKLKRIAVLQPHIRHLYLVSVCNLLFEHSITVADTAAVSCIAQSRQGIQKACCQSSQTSVAKSRVRLLILNDIQIQANLFQSFLHFIVKGQINQVVSQSAAHQKLHRHIVYNLWIFFLIFLLGGNPCIHNRILDCIAYRLENLLIACLLNLFSEKCTYIIFYASDKKLFVKDSFRHSIPPFTVFLLQGSRFPH